VISDFDTYEEARRFEVQWLNDCRLQGINPIEQEGLEVMKDLRWPMQATKPEGPANDVVKSTFGCERYKSVFKPIDTPAGVITGRVSGIDPNFTEQDVRRIFKE